MCHLYPRQRKPVSASNQESPPRLRGRLFGPKNVDACITVSPASSGETEEGNRVSPEFWAIAGVGVTLTAVGVTAITFGWSMYARLGARLAAVEKGQARIEGWIAGCFREETVS